MKELTKAEERVMQALWKIRKGFVKDILEHFPDPKPAYTTISTITRILQEKGFVTHKAYGRTHEYIPAVSKEQYSKFFLKNFVRDYFSNSYRSMISFCVLSKCVTIKDLEGVKRNLLSQARKKKQKK